MEIKIDDNGILYCDGTECITYASNLACKENCPMASIAENVQRGKRVDTNDVFAAPTPVTKDFQDCSSCYFGGKCKFNPCPLPLSWHFEKRTK